MVVLATPDLVESAWDTAVTVTVAGLGTATGAAYSPLLPIVPIIELPPATPFTSHFTTVFSALETTAVNCWVDPTCTRVEEGESETEITDGDGGVSSEGLLVEPPPHLARDNAMPRQISGASNLSPIMARIVFRNELRAARLLRLDGTNRDAVASGCNQQRGDAAGVDLKTGPPQISLNPVTEAQWLQALSCRKKYSEAACSGI